ncbi:Cytochrome c551 peroxidase [Labilithrix luteola]|uniref:Cytochrome c551 peroxidase n=1 Tax=Labilithrix luteola TaxID=1391654 RepID=A0A0K1PTQ6_9BACT|nr:c-type cytochrome [Labilithrix luteola]AKU96741.1 Cytochrome c551 peroxidase [Labilithrix luteola]
MISKTWTRTLFPLLAVAAACGSKDHEQLAAAGGVAATPPPGPQPDLGPLIQATKPPPPISGGTLAVTRDRATIVAADTDRDLAYVVDLAGRALVRTVNLPPGSEPGRVAIGLDRVAHVVLRKAGKIASFALDGGEVDYRDVCATPRGIGVDNVRSALKVTCASGELLTVPLDGSAISSVNVERDLRDVVVNTDGTTFVSTFRSAKLLRVAKGAVGSSRTSGSIMMAWRAAAAPVDDPPASSGDGGSGTDAGTPEPTNDDGEIAVVGQEASPEPVQTTPGGYGSGVVVGPGTDCGATASGIVTTHLSLANGGDVNLPDAVLPVDLATNGRDYVVVAAGNAFTPSLPQLFVVQKGSIDQSGTCVPVGRGNVPGQAVAAIFGARDQLVVQTREPAALHIMSEDRLRPWKTIPLANDSRADTGHILFHVNAGGHIACASCHGEGGDDAHTWTFVDMGPRRTPSLLGTVAHTEPFHWDGDMTDLRTLVDHVFVGRMSGPQVDDQHLEVLRSWLYALPAPAQLRPSTDVAATRGSTLFGQRCASCHSGPSLTNNKTEDVGTGKAFQVPSLVGVAWRGPFLHDGCATTLRDRFLPGCGGTKHGDTSDLSPAQIDDLVAFLETL